MHSSRIHTSRALTAFGKKMETPKKIGGPTPQEIGDTPSSRKIGDTPPPRKIGRTPLKNWRPPKKLETPKKLENHPPSKNWTPPPKNSRTPPRGQTHACKLITLLLTSFAGGNKSTETERLIQVIHTQFR